MKRGLYILLLLLSACSVGKKQPEWTLQQPFDNGYYSAVVKIPKKAPNYKELARNEAIREISTQISVQIDSDIALKETEANGIPSSELISSIRSSSNNKIRDLQLVGTYETKNDYWAYYRLSKSEYYAWRKNQCEQATAQALNLLNEFDLSQTNLTSGISALIKGLELIVDYTDMELTTSYRNKQINLYNELFFRLNHLTEKVKINYAEKEIDLTAKQRERKSIAVFVNYQQEIPVNNYPVCFNFLSGKGEIVAEGLTDENGKAELIINRITSFSTPQFIEAKPDKDFWLVGIENPIVKTMFGNLQFLPATLKLNVNRPKAFVQYSFNNTSGTDYRNILLKKLQDLDLEVSTNQNESDYTFKVNIITRNSEFLPLLKQYSAVADAYIELIDSRTGKSIYNTNLTGIKSVAVTTDAVKGKNELDAVNELCDKVMFMLVQQYIMY
ncbi:MAG TPA: LPP20 family lipoprotein [Candidatus Cloacimonas sp.]|nr:LPP20 family lipoprotein [Candidatus Cloacimonas sp.]